MGTQSRGPFQRFSAAQACKRSQAVASGCKRLQAFRGSSRPSFVLPKHACLFPSEDPVGVVAQRLSSWKTDAKRLPTVCHCSTTTGDPLHTALVGFVGLVGLLGLQGAIGVATGLHGLAMEPQGAHGGLRGLRGLIRARTGWAGLAPGVASWKMLARLRPTVCHWSKWIGEAPQKLGELAE